MIHWRSIVGITSHCFCSWFTRPSKVLCCTTRKSHKCHRSSDITKTWGGSIDRSWECTYIGSTTYWRRRHNDHSWISRRTSRWWATWIWYCRNIGDSTSCCSYLHMKCNIWVKCIRGNNWRWSTANIYCPCTSPSWCWYWAIKHDTYRKCIGHGSDTARRSWSLIFDSEYIIECVSSIEYDSSTYGLSIECIDIFFDRYGEICDGRSIVGITSRTIWSAIYSSTSPAIIDWICSWCEKT